MVAIAGGRIARIAENIPAAQARQVYSAAGRLVTAGLIDMHTHVYRYAINLSVDSDIVGFQNGVTTVLDCGSTGAGSFMGLRKYVMESAQTRFYALLNISSIGLIVTNEIYLDPAKINPRAAIQMIESHRDRLIGVNIRINGKHSDLAHDVEVLKAAREVADATAGVELDRIFRTGLFLRFPLKNHPPESVVPLKNPGRPPNCPRNVELGQRITPHC